jgi:MoaA/NifB/PqqE/SkfB family radical SAM enzyme
MIEKLFGRFLRREKRKLFSAWQIELTTRCPLRCRMCAREAEASWQHRDMALDDFRKILPYLADVETVVLEGWGESLLHRDLATCIRLVKQEGPRVGFVTSGFGVTRDRVHELLEAGLDFVGFSVSGATARTHDAIRVHSHLPDLLSVIRLFHEAKRSLSLQRPGMHIVFLMLRDNIAELPAIPALAREAGIEEVVAINICHTLNPWQEAQRVFSPDGAAAGGDEALIRQAETNARKLKIRFKRPALSASEYPVCSENPLSNLYISAEGEVSPCVYLYPPLPSPFRRIFCGKEYRIEKVSFGNIFRDPFPAIWGCRDYEDFRARFLQRQREHRELCLSLLDSPKLKSPRGDLLSPPPEPCQTCHKIIGV